MNIFHQYTLNFFEYPNNVESGRMRYMHFGLSMRTTTLKSILGNLLRELITLFFGISFFLFSVFCIPYILHLNLSSILDTLYKIKDLILAVLIWINRDLSQDNCCNFNPNISDCMNNEYTCQKIHLQKSLSYCSNIHILILYYNTDSFCTTEIIKFIIILGSVWMGCGYIILAKHAIKNIYTHSLN